MIGFFLRPGGGIAYEWWELATMWLTFTVVSIVMCFLQRYLILKVETDARRALTTYIWLSLSSIPLGVFSWAPILLWWWVGKKKRKKLNAA